MEKYIKVVFKESCVNKFTSKKYSYKTDFDVQINDLVIVDTQFGFALAKVVEADLLIEEINYNVDELKTVVCICDTSAFYDKQKKHRHEKLLFQKLEMKIKEATKQKALDEITEKLELCKDQEFSELYLEYTKLFN